jgi:hypothetical protein
MRVPFVGEMQYLLATVLEVHEKWRVLTKVWRVLLRTSES